MRNLLILLSLCIFSCSEKKENAINGKPILLNDPNLIVTETDSNKLKNIVADITPFKSNTKEISKLVAQVDSVTTVKATAQIASNGLTPNILYQNEFAVSTDITFSNLGKKFKTNNYLEEFKIAVSNLQRVNVQQKCFVQLKFVYNNKDYPLTDLPELGTTPIALTQSNELFIGLKNSAITYKNIDNITLNLAIERALRKAQLDRKELKEALAYIKNAKNYTEAGCLPVLKGFEILIKGNTKDKEISKKFLFVI